MLVIPDFVQGTVYRGKKKDGTPAKFFNIMIFEVDPKTEQPIVIEKKTIGAGKNAKEVERHKVFKVFRVAESSLLKVAAGEAKSCNLYYSLPRFQ